MCILAIEPDKIHYVKFEGCNVSVGVLNSADGSSHIVGVCPDHSGCIVGNYSIYMVWGGCGRVYELQLVIHMDTGSIGIVFSSERENDIPIGEP